jgi:hypothetical protein
MPGMRPSADLQDKLAIADTVAGLRAGGEDSDPEARLAIMRTMLEREAVLQRAADALSAVQQTVEELFAELEIVGPKQREFVRKASRLRSEQRAMLERNLATPSDFVQAAERLDAVYAHHVSVAMSYSPSLRSPGWRSCAARTSILEPPLIGMMDVGIGGMVVAMYLPMFDLMKTVQG